MVKYSYLAEYWDGTIELPDVDDRKALFTILTKEAGVVAIWRLALPHEIPDLGKCRRIFTCRRDLTFALIFRLLITWVGILKYRNAWNKVYWHTKAFLDNPWGRINHHAFVLKWRIKNAWKKAVKQGNEKAAG